MDITIQVWLYEHTETMDMGHLFRQPTAHSSTITCNSLDNDNEAFILWLNTIIPFNVFRTTTLKVPAQTSTHEANVPKPICANMTILARKMTAAITYSRFTFESHFKVQKILRHSMHPEAFCLYPVEAGIFTVNQVYFGRFSIP